MTQEVKGEMQTNSCAFCAFLRLFPLPAFEALTLEDLPILIPIDDVSEEANHSHDDNDDNRRLKCQNHKR